MRLLSSRARTLLCSASESSVAGVALRSQPCCCHNCPVMQKFRGKASMGAANTKVHV